MKHLIVLCGVENSGKTNTLKKFFRFEGKRWSKNKLTSRPIYGKIVYSVGANSPQELNKKYKEDTPTFVKKIKERISEVTEKCEKESSGEDYVLIIPFTIYKHSRKEKLYEESIQEPIDWIKDKYNVETVYLQKVGYKWENLTYEFMSRLVPEPYIIESHERYELQSEKLESIVKKLPA
jgi:hypothetical protein